MAAVQAAAPVWRIAETVLWRDWEGEIVAYNERTGDTHHFVDIAAWLFRALSVHPAPRDALAAEAEIALELTRGSDIAGAIDETLALFRRLRLIAAAPPP